MTRALAMLALLLSACAECPRGELVERPGECGAGCASAVLTSADETAEPPCGRPHGALCLGEETGEGVSGFPGCVVGASGTVFVTDRVLSDAILSSQGLRRCDAAELAIAQSANASRCGETAP